MYHVTVGNIGYVYMVSSIKGSFLMARAKSISMVHQVTLCIGYILKK